MKQAANLPSIHPTTHMNRKPHNFTGTPNPVLTPLKRFIRAHGGQWPARAWIIPNSPPPPPPAPTLRVFALWHGPRRFIVRAQDEAAAQNILNHQLK